MNSENQEKYKTQAHEKPLRLWPGVVIVLLQWLMRFVIPVFIPDVLAVGVFAGIFLGLAVLVWWAFFSRAPRFERWGAIVLIIAALLATSQIVDKSIATANLGLMFIIYSIPVMSLAFVVWAVLSRRLSTVPRRITMVVTILLASGFWAFLRTNGMTSNLHHDLAWRWAKTQEERFLTQAADEQMTLPSEGGSVGYWPGFRGPNRDGIFHGAKIKTDWKASPPVVMWRRQIGPGCSSFAVNGQLLYTQEQRGEYEVVSCYDLTTGKPVWIHKDKARFWDSHAGAGPRGTPTVSNGRIYTFGGTGILNVLNAMDGSVIWSRNPASDTGAKNSGWGYTSSPLVVDSTVIVAVSGKLAAYDITTGKPRWVGPDEGKGYSSPHLITIQGVQQVALMSDSGATSLSPADGKILWMYHWPVMDRILQPALTEEGDLLLTGAMNNGIRRIAVANEPDGWKITERWITGGVTPYFNDIVVHKGHIYGFTGPSLTCIDIQNGKHIWRGGRYGGQLILLADQDLILVLSEKGELGLVAAVPDKFNELARFPAISGKTWNHPVLVGNILLVRNSSEMAALKLPAEGN